MVVFLLLGWMPIPLLLALALALYLTGVELREMRESWLMWMWWLSLVFLTHFVGYLILGSTLSTAAGTRRALRDRPLGKVALLVGVLLLAFVVSRGCAGSGSEISKEEAIAIATREVDYKPDRTQVRLVRRGFQSRAFWAVSLSTLDARGALDRVTVVLVDAKTREVAEIRTSRQ